jgi:hypothetical protein
MQNSAEKMTSPDINKMKSLPFNAIKSKVLTSLAKIKAD